MVEFILVFALGFLAATIIVMMITPVILRRVARRTERRIRVSMPHSSAEADGRADLTRARFASETARLSGALRHERNDAASKRLQTTRLQRDLAVLAGQKREAEHTIAELTTQSAALRSESRRKQLLIEKLTLGLSDFERVKQADMREINRLNDDLTSISTEVESMKIELAASGTEAVNLRAQIDAHNAEKQRLQDDLKAMAATAREFEQACRLEQERHNSTRIDLAASQSSLSNAEMKLDGMEDRIAAMRQERDNLVKTQAREQAHHNTTRAELETARSTLAANETTLRQAGETIAAQTKRLRELTEAERQNRQALEEAQQKIALLTGQMEETRSALAGGKRSAKTVLHAVPPQAGKKPRAPDSQPAAAAPSNGQDARSQSQTETAKATRRRGKSASGRKTDRMRAKVAAPGDGTKADGPEAPSERRRAGRPMPSDASLKNRMDDLRTRQQALIDALKAPGNADNDNRLREELADIAALVLSLSAASEPKASPLAALIAGKDKAKAGRRSLAARARAEIKRRAP